VTSLVVTEHGDPVGYAQWCEAGGQSGGIDLILAPEAQGRGLGSDAAEALVRYLFDVLGWQRVTVDPAPRNVRAVRMWRKVGFLPLEESSETLLMARDR
jgi:aminoglycoside 6'-N-acetyltransferase